jgi:hypothetical protein
MKLNKVSGLFMAFMIAISLTGLAYAHWSDTVKIEGTIKMAHIRIKIISHKALLSKEVEEYSEIISEISGDGHLLTLTCTNLRPCWYTWIGLKTQNEGSLPANVKTPEYSFEPPDGFEDYFETNHYFYGPFPEKEDHGNPIHEVWRDATIGEELLEDGTPNFPIDHEEIVPFTVEPGEKVVIWIWIHCSSELPNDAQGKEVTLYIHIVDDPAI